MFIITKTFTDDEGHLFTKVNPKQYSTPGEAYDAMREDYLNELKSRGLEDNGSSNDDGESCPGGFTILQDNQQTHHLGGPAFCFQTIKGEIIMYCIQYDEICKKHNFELKHDALGERVTLEYPADSVPKDTIRLFQNHLPEGVSAMAEKYSSDRFAIFRYNAAAAAGNTIGLTETLEKNKKVSAALSDLADDLKQAELEAKTWVCTDPDTCQWQRQVGGTRYELYDIFEAPNGTYFVVHGEVDPTELDPDDYDQLLEAYSGLLDSANCESERWALIAEAQFETEELSMERERFSTFEGAERAIWKKVGADVSDENSATETRLDAIRKLDKFHLAVFLNDVHSGAKDFPSNNMSWCDWLNKPDDGHLLDVKTAR